MGTPFFSVIIPTKNRPDLLRDAIASVLGQNFDDYELIVSDNYNDERTQKTIDGFLGNPHLVGIRTTRELNMPDHWEWMTQKARGAYILILTDRSLLRQGALKKIYGVIQAPASSGIPVYTWQHEIFEIGPRMVRPVSKRGGGVRIFSGGELLTGYARQQRADWRYPAVLNGCYRRDVAETIRKKHGRMFVPVSPDATGGFLLLSYAGRIACISEPLFLMQTAKNSNGAAYSAIGPDFYLRTLNLDVSDWYRHAPAKASFIHNLSFSDFMRVREMVGRESLSADIDWATYFLRCYEDFVYFGTRGYIKNRKEEFFNAWRKGLASFDEGTQARVRKGMFRIRLLFAVKAVLAQSPFLRLLRSFQSRLRYGASNKRYKSALEAAGFGADAPPARLQEDAKLR